MRPTLRAALMRHHARIARWLHGNHMLAFLPALALAGFWIGGEVLLIVIAIGVPLVYALAGQDAPGTLNPDRPLPDLIDLATATALADHMIDRATTAKLGTACVLVEAEGLDVIRRRAGDTVAQELQETLLQRLRGQLRRGDRVARIGDSRFLVLLSPSLRLDLDALLIMANRMQRALEEPAETEAGTHFLSAAIGFCPSSRLRGHVGGAQLIDAATTALSEALANGPSAVRAWSESMRVQRRARKTLLEEVERALAKGQIGRGSSPSSAPRPAPSAASRCWRAGCTRTAASCPRPSFSPRSKRPDSSTG